MDVDKKKFISTYKQCKKNIKMIKVLLNKKWYREKWCKKRNIEVLENCELERDLKRYQEQLDFMNLFIVRWYK